MANGEWMNDNDIKYAFESDRYLKFILEYHNGSKKSYLFVSDSAAQYPGESDILPFNIMGTHSSIVTMGDLYINMIKGTMSACFGKFSRVICEP